MLNADSRGPVWKWRITTRRPSPSTKLHEDGISWRGLDKGSSVKGLDALLARELLFYLTLGLDIMVRGHIM